MKKFTILSWSLLAGAEEQDWPGMPHRRGIHQVVLWECGQEASCEYCCIKIMTIDLPKQDGLSSKAFNLYSEGDKFESQPGHWLTWLRFFMVFLKFQDRVLTLWLPSLTIELPAGNANAVWYNCTEKPTMLSSSDFRTAVCFTWKPIFSSKCCYITLDAI
jgi:hypothetical protein